MHLFLMHFSGQTALHRAISHGYFDIVLLLLGYGASFEINDSKFKSPVQYCCKPKNYVTHQQQSHIKEQLVRFQPNLSECTANRIAFLMFRYSFRFSPEIH